MALVRGKNYFNREKLYFSESRIFITFNEQCEYKL